MFLCRYADRITGEEMELCYRELEQSMTIEGALDAFLAENSDKTISYSAHGVSWYAAMIVSDSGQHYRKAFLKDQGTVLCWFDYYVWGDPAEVGSSQHIEYIEDRFIVQ